MTRRDGLLSTASPLPPDQLQFLKTAFRNFGARSAAKPRAAKGRTETVNDQAARAVNRLRRSRDDDQRVSGLVDAGLANDR